MMDLLDVGILVIDEELRVTLWNKWLELHTKIKKEDALGKTIDVLFPDINLKVFKRKAQTTLALATPSYYSASFDKPFIKIPNNKILNSRYKFLRLSASLYPFEKEGKKIALMIYDQTDQVEARAVLNETNNDLIAEREIVDTYVLSLKTNAEGNIIDASKAFCELGGYSKSELLGKKPNIFKSPNVSNELYKKLWDTISAGGVWSGEFLNLKKDGECYWAATTITPIFDEHQSITGYKAILQDITDKKKVEELSLTDSLTKIYNRAKFNESLESEIYRAQRYGSKLSLIIVDADHFKSINDTFGHLAGDEVLKGIARILKENLRISDILARYGGEEFVILLPFTDTHTAQMIAQKLREKVRIENFPHGKTVTCSFGVAELLSEDTEKTLFKRADQALYEAKNGGRDRVVGI